VSNWVTLPRLNALRFREDPVPMAKLWRWCREGRLPARKIGGEWYVDLEAFDAPAPAKTGPGEVVQLAIERLRAVR